jgi:hypothetical protein
MGSSQDNEMESTWHGSERSEAGVFFTALRDDTRRV